jgi:membrane protein YdbS with pleckstrin-like domain
MTPDEEAEIGEKQKNIERASWIIAIPVGLVIAAAMIAFFWTLGGETKIYLGQLVLPIVLVSFAISAFLVGRLYRKYMERKLGRRLKSEYELTSLSSWMDVSQKDKSK